MTKNKYTLTSEELKSETLRSNKQLLDILLYDNTTEKNIKWGTESYALNGDMFHKSKEITADLITGWYNGFIRPRSKKESAEQLNRTRSKAEVFTPSWIIKLQVNAAMEEFKELSLSKFISTKWLEITCGEAPYMANRYDMTDGKNIPLKERAGFIDIKFKRLNKEINDHDEWVESSKVIYQSSYGYEYQGDSLLLARENLLLTFFDNYFYQFGAFPDDKLVKEITEIIMLNVFQMDGLTYEVPFSDNGVIENEQLSFFDIFDEEDEVISAPQLASIKLWNKNSMINFKNLVRGDLNKMKFDVVIGNPPFQEEVEDNGRKNQIFPYFMDSSYQIADKSILITPAKFLFNAGHTPKSWNRRMLADPHLKVLYYEEESKKVFENKVIKGGVAITYHNNKEIIGPVGNFIPFVEMELVLSKVKACQTQTLVEADMIYTSASYKLNNDFYKVYPKALKTESKKPTRFIETNSFSMFDFAYSEEENKDNDTLIWGLKGRIRTKLWINSKLINVPDNHSYYRVALPKSNGEGKFGEILTGPFIIDPKIGHTKTFMTLGKFKTQSEAKGLLSYLKTKFFRSLLGISKVTQDNSINTFRLIPLQDFTDNSDINWTVSISEIDQQLYTKYNLSEEEINFIETKVKEMD